jgi:hypothetical protein
MKNLRTIFLSIFVIGVLAINVSIVGSRSNGAVSLSSLKSALADPIEEIEIICSAGPSGRCYKQISQSLEMCGERNGWRIECEYSGCTLDYCVPQTPCS